MSVEVMERYGLTYDKFNLDDRVTFKNVFLNKIKSKREYLNGRKGIVVDRTPSFVKVKLEEGSFFKNKNTMWFLEEHLEET